MAWTAIGGAATSAVVGKVFGKKKKNGGGSAGGSPPPPNPMIAESARINLDAAKVGFTNAADLLERYKSMYQPTGIGLYRMRTTSTPWKTLTKRQVPRQLVCSRSMTVRLVRLRGV